MVTPATDSTQQPTLTETDLAYTEAQQISTGEEKGTSNEESTSIPAASENEFGPPFSFYMEHRLCKPIVEHSTFQVVPFMPGYAFLDVGFSCDDGLKLRGSLHVENLTESVQTLSSRQIALTSAEGESLGKFRFRHGIRPRLLSAGEEMDETWDFSLYSGTIIDDSKRYQLVMKEEETRAPIAEFEIDFNREGAINTACDEFVEQKKEAALFYGLSGAFFVGGGAYFAVMAHLSDYKITYGTLVGAALSSLMITHSFMMFGTARRSNPYKVVRGYCE